MESDRQAVKQARKKKNSSCSGPSYRDHNSEDSENSDFDESSYFMEDNMKGNNKWNSSLNLLSLSKLHSSCIPRTKHRLRHDDLEVALSNSPLHGTILLKANERNKLKKREQVMSGGISQNSPNPPEEEKLPNNIENQITQTKDRVSNYIRPPSFLYESKFQVNNFSCQFQYQNGVKSESKVMNRSHNESLEQTTEPIDKTIFDHKAVDNDGSEVLGVTPFGNNKLSGDASTQREELNHQGAFTERVNPDFEQDRNKTFRNSKEISDLEETLSNISLSETNKKYNIGIYTGICFQGKDMSFKCLPNPTSEKFVFHYEHNPTGTYMYFKEDDRDLFVETKEN